MQTAINYFDLIGHLENAATDLQLWNMESQKASNIKEYWCLILQGSPERLLFMAQGPGESMASWDF